MQMFSGHINVQIYFLIGQYQVWGLSIGIEMQVFVEKFSFSLLSSWQAGNLVTWLFHLINLDIITFLYVQPSRARQISYWQIDRLEKSFIGQDKSDHYLIIKERSLALHDILYEREVGENLIRQFYPVLLIFVYLSK